VTVRLYGVTAVLGRTMISIIESGQFDVEKTFVCPLMESKMNPQVTKGSGGA